MTYEILHWLQILAVSYALGYCCGLLYADYRDKRR